jgi:hypothetical protein
MDGKEAGDWMVGPATAPVKERRGKDKQGK